MQTEQSCAAEGLQFWPLVVEACGGGWEPTALLACAAVKVGLLKRSGCCRPLASLSSGRMPGQCCADWRALRLSCRVGPSPVRFPGGAPFELNGCPDSALLLLFPGCRSALLTAFWAHLYHLPFFVCPRGAAVSFRSVPSVSLPFSPVYSCLVFQGCV